MYSVGKLPDGTLTVVLDFVRIDWFVKGLYGWRAEVEM